MQQTSKKLVDSSYERQSKALRRSTVLNGNQKVLYAYMLDKYMFFKSKGLEFYESGDTLAEEIGTSRNTVLTCLKGLVEQGFVRKVTRKKKGAQLECVYEVEDRFNLFS